MHFSENDFTVQQAKSNPSFHNKSPLDTIVIFPWILSFEFNFGIALIRWHWRLFLMRILFHFPYREKICAPAIFFLLLQLSFNLNRNFRYFSSNASIQVFLSHFHSNASSWFVWNRSNKTKFIVIFWFARTISSPVYECDLHNIEKRILRRIFRVCFEWIIRKQFAYAWRQFPGFRM